MMTNLFRALGGPMNLAMACLAAVVAAGVGAVCVLAWATSDLAGGVPA